MPEYFGEFRSPLHGRIAKVSGPLQKFVSSGRTGDEGEKFKIQAKLHREARTREAGGYFVKRILNAPERGPEVAKYVEKWLRLKDLGVPVVDTLRVDTGTNDMLMTDVTEAGKNKVFDTNRILRKNFGRIANLEELKDQTKQIAEQAYDNGNGVWLNVDSYAAVVNKQHKGKIMVLDLGVGAFLLKDGYIEGGGASVSREEALSGANEFVEEVLEGRGNPFGNYWVG